MQHPTDIQARIMARVDIEDRGHSTPCWVSNRWTDRHGYTSISVHARWTLTHRVAYEAFVGPIPDGLDLDHLCRVRACCNPDHLEPVTRKVNLRRGAGGASATHCPQGHAYDEANTYVSKGVYPRRGCRTCRDTANLKFRQRNKAAVDNI